MYGIDVHDELTHPRDPDPAWRESYWFDLVDRDKGVGLLIYVGVQPGAGHGYGLVHVADRKGEVLLQDRRFELPVQAHEPGRSELAVGDFQVRLERPLQRQGIQFVRDGSELTLAFSSESPIYDYPWEWTRSRHYEQLGQATAKLEISGAAPLELSGAAARDHAWGLRGLRPWRYWLWMTDRGKPGEPRWSACWVEDEERAQLVGHLVDGDGGVHTLRALDAEIRHGADGPEGVRLELTFGRRPLLQVDLDLFGSIDLSNADAAKQGGYYFAFTDGGDTGGTFDVFWRSDLERLTRVVSDGS